MYDVKFSNKIPSPELFEEWGIQEAYPKFYLNVEFFEDKEKIMYFKLKYEGHYMCQGNGLSIEKVSVDEYNVSDFSKEQVEEILEYFSENKNFEKKFKKSIKGTLLERTNECHISAWETLTGYDLS